MLKGPKKDPHAFEKGFWLAVLVLVFLSILGHALADQIPRSSPNLYLVPHPKAPEWQQWEAVPVPIKQKEHVSAPVENTG